MGLFSNMFGSSKQLKKEEPKKRGKSKKRYSKLIRKQHKTKVELGQNKLDEAIYSATDPYYPNRDGLYEIYEQTVRDAHIRREMRTAGIKVSGEPFYIKNKQSGQESEDLLRLLKRPWMRKYLKLMLDAEWWGHSVVEFQQMKETEIGLEFCDVKLFPREHINPVKGEILIHPHSPSGIPYRGVPEVEKWLIESDDSEDLGLLELASKEFIWKNFSRTDWATRSERYGMPMLSILTDETDEKELDTKQAMGENIGSNGVYVGDKDDEINYLEAKSTGGHEIYEKLCRYCDEQNSKLINGVVIGENTSGGSRAKEEVGERLLGEYTEDRLRAMEGHLNEKLIPFLIRHGYPLEGYELKYYELEKIDQRRIAKKEEETSPVKQAEAITNLYNDKCC
ncbi:phage portal protein family protein [Flammeovirga aprica]|uniref:DUF935 family protein n=1 Tax=Flammeovirga aprica JL-4 TaxID=694437 RepID=A0A7X9RUM5_9BACT|nr:DUF935 family protein [Flammeovirga aprica]NME69016.1 DUF935 family protein [Flammeovirga aprica JL-4]